MSDLRNEIDAVKVQRGGKEGLRSTQTDEGVRRAPPAPVFRPELLNSRPDTANEGSFGIRTVYLISHFKNNKGAGLLTSSAA